MKKLPDSSATHDTTSKSESDSKQARYGHGRIIEIDCTNGVNPREAQKVQKSAARAYGVPVEITNKIGMSFRFIPAGQFWMGSPANELYREKDESQHIVKIAKPFYISMTEVTQAQYWSVTGQKPSQLQNKPNHPVETVNLDEVKGFCVKLSQLDKEHTYQLPTDAQFEYASRAGALGPTYGPINTISWHSDNAHGKTHPVAMLLPNSWGLYDTLGNVWEWCSKGESGTVKGLSIHFAPRDHRFAYARSNGPNSRFYDIGFRVCILIDDK